MATDRNFTVPKASSARKGSAKGAAHLKRQAIYAKWAREAAAKAKPK